MTRLDEILNYYGIVGVKAIQTVLRPESATGETVASIRYEVKIKDTIHSLIYYGRKYLGAMETGRGPRTSSEYQEFDKKMLKWMDVRGIGADLNPKKKAQLARFLAYKINKEGDELHKKGGRVVYTPTVEKLADEIIDAVSKDFIQSAVTRIKNGFNDNQTANRP